MFGLDELSQPGEESEGQSRPPPRYFPSLTDVKIKCEVYVSNLPPAVVDNILATTSECLTILQVKKMTHLTYMDWYRQ